MSRQHINAYRTKLAKLHAVSGSLNEGVISQAFGSLLEAWGRSHDLTLVQQWEGKGPRGNDIKVDGALVPSVLRVPFGYWEAKDSKDDLDREIGTKIAAGYPDDNIIYENSVTAVLRQDGREVDRAPLQGADEALLALLNCFFDYERTEIAEFRKAAAQFRADLPQILEALRGAIGEAEKENYAYAAAAKAFLDHAREAINPLVTAEDVREMLIQHILTEEIFTSVFDNAQYHRENNVAEKLTELEGAFFTGDLRHQTTLRLRPYYSAIKGAAAETPDRREKQVFLKKLYEDFYKVYNPKAADRLGVVYTPGEIVRFMIRGAEWLCERHFGKTLIDTQVEILDPATGTGTFIVELLEHFAGDRDRLRTKYKNELHANEVAILPYYVANLNIEATYAAITGQYAEFPGLVFVDTLDNTAGLGKFSGHMDDMFGSMSDENMDRIKRQNERKISVIIGNPPYNANQQNENENNKNRAYPKIDKRIKETYVKASTAQKTKVYDMYARFYRWSSDRLRDEGIIAFITNRSFIESRTFDGFRKTVAKDFSEIWIVDLGGDVRANPKLSGTTHNVFGIQTGVAIAFFVRRKEVDGCMIRYSRRPEFETATDKLAWLSQSDLDSVVMQTLKPSERFDWVVAPGGADWPNLLAVANAETKSALGRNKDRAVFKSYSLGFSTNRDEWVLGDDKHTLGKKTKYLVEEYQAAPRIPNEKARKTIKWSELLLRRKAAGGKEQYDKSRSKKVAYRPFNKLWLYDSKVFIDRRGVLADPDTIIIAISGTPAGKPFQTLATDVAVGLDALEKTKCLPRHRYTKSGERLDNVTDWALKQFRGYYADEFSREGPGPKRSNAGALPSPGNKRAEISKDDIFAYVYAVLHDPIYRETYAADLRREFPRIPFYPDFARWADWGRALLDLHIGYENAKPWKLTRTDTPTRGAPSPKLKSEAENGLVVVDSGTQLSGIPTEAWDYRLGNRSAIDWVLDQHKEKKIRDSAVATKFNTYKFADHKENMIKVLAKVVVVSVETVKITEAMKTFSRQKRRG